MANFKKILLCISTVLIGVKSQYVDQNYQVRDYPFVSDRQPYPQSIGVLYGGPYNSFGMSQPVNYNPVDTHGNAYQGGAIFPYPYQYGAQTIPQNGPLVPVGSQSIPKGTQLPSVNQKAPYPYAGVKTEIIDIDPDEFRRLMKDHMSEVQIVSYEAKRTSNRGSYVYQPKYIIQTESKQYNKTTVPQSISKHEVQSKSTSFNKTFVIHSDGEKVINLNFVNGVQVTEPSEVPEELRKVDEDDETTTSPTTALPKKDGRRFIDVPGGCEEGLGFAATGGCHSLFQLSLNRTNPNITTTTSKPTTVQEVHQRINNGRHH